MTDTDIIAISSLVSVAKWRNYFSINIALHHLK